VTHVFRPKENISNTLFFNDGELEADTTRHTMN